MNDLPPNRSDRLSNMKTDATSSSSSGTRGDAKPEVVVVNKTSGLMKLLVFLILGAAVIALGYWMLNMRAPSGHGENKKNHPVPVTVATARVQNVPIQIRSIGNVMPYSVVNVMPQVSGQLTKVFFTQGQFVKKGDLLFQIDPRPYQAAYDQVMGNVAKDQAGIETAQANLSRDQAQIGVLQATLSKDTESAKYADAERSRYASLVHEGAVSHEQSDQMATNAATAQAQIDADKKAVQNAREVVKADRANVLTAKAQLEADQAAANNAKLQLSWCQIHSPIDGRTGSLNVYEGNIVSGGGGGAGSTVVAGGAGGGQQPLVTIDQIQPIYIQFTLPEQSLDPIRSSMAKGTLKVEAMIEGQRTDSVVGTVSFLENTVSTTSGTVSLRATFANTSKRLFPGQFVDVIVSMPPDGNSVVVPASAVQTTQQGNAVYVVTSDNTAKFVPVQLSRTIGDLAAIGKGVNAGDVVVTDGQLQLMPGSKVSIEKNADQTAGNIGLPTDDASDNGN